MDKDNHSSDFTKNYQENKNLVKLKNNELNTKALNDKKYSLDLSFIKKNDVDLNSLSYMLNVIKNNLFNFLFLNF